MTNTPPIRVAIIDYTLGNLFSVRSACEEVGLNGTITSSKAEILSADAVILPGVGAFADAMAELHRLDLIKPLQDIAKSGKLLIGICLGMQLLMTESHEFGHHDGLNILEGEVVRFENPIGSFGIGQEMHSRKLKVPQVGWNVICKPAHKLQTKGDNWQGTALNGLTEGTYMYFVHSYYTKPKEIEDVLAVSNYGNIEFCSVMQRGNVLAFQFHPERSGPKGLQIYRNISDILKMKGEK